MALQTIPKQGGGIQYLDPVTGNKYSSVDQYLLSQVDGGGFGPNQQAQDQINNLQQQLQGYIQAQTANQSGNYGPLLSTSTQNADGSWTAPEYNSILDSETGLLEDPYILNNTLNTAGLDKYREEALRDAGTPSAWLQLAEEQNNANTMNQYSDLGQQLNAARRSAYDNLASTGGLDSGARERIAQGSLNDFLRQRQSIANQGNLANLDLLKTDEQNRLKELSTLPGLEIQKSQFDNDIQKQNVANALNERNQTFNAAMDAWKQRMNTWGANKQADAQASASSGGGGCCFIFLEARYGTGAMDKVVRRYRDEHMTKKNQRGYYKLSEVLVPLMRKSKTVKALVRLFMTDPLVAYGKAYYGEGSKVGFLFSPLKNFWLRLFDYLGEEHPFIRENGETV